MFLSGPRRLAVAHSTTTASVFLSSSFCQHRSSSHSPLFSRMNIHFLNAGATVVSTIKVASVAPVQFCCRRSRSSSPSLKVKRHQQLIVDAAQAIYEKLFSDKKDHTLVNGGEARKHHETFLETVDLIGQRLPPEKLTSSSTSSFSFSSEQPQHLRMISLELAKWIDKNPKCTGWAFSDFYRTKLPEVVGAECFWSTWTPLFDDEEFRTYVSDTILDVIEKAFYSVEKPLTIAEFPARGSFDRVRDHFTSIDESLGRNVISQDHVADDVARRNVKCPLLLPSKNDNTHLCTSKVKLQQDRLTIICGASGAGKTITSLAVATLRNRLAKKGKDIVIYMELSHRFYVEKEKDSDPQATRDKGVFKWVLNSFYSIINTGNTYLAVDDREDYNVIFIIDQVGCNPEFLPGLCSMLPKLVTTLHNKMFTHQITETENGWRKSRVRFIAAGTGASLATSLAASNPSRYRTYFVESHPSDTFYVAQLEALQKNLQRNIDKVLKKKKERKVAPPKHLLTESDLNDIFSMLRRIDRTEQDKIVEYNTHPFVNGLQYTKQRYQKPCITATEKAAADLVRNRRCAALLIRKAIVHSFQFDSSKDNEESAYVDALTGTVDVTSIPWWKSVAKFNERLRAWLPEITSTYIAMNRLSSALDPVNIIKYAIATSLFRLPCLPDEFRSGSSSSSVPDYIDTLIVKGGVLVDLATTTATAAEEEEKILIHLNDFISPKKLQKPRQSTGDSEANVVWALKKSSTTRFLTSPAHVVMFRTACGLPIERSPEFSYSLEHDLADFCAMTLICASAYLKMRREIIELYPNGEGLSKLDEFDKLYNYKYDSLFGLKKKLAHEYCGIDGHGIRGAKILHLVDSPLCSINEYAATEHETARKYLEKVARVKTNVLCSDLEASLERGKAVVIISKDMGQFADVIVVSPGRVMLIQCKQLQWGGMTTRWMDEIEKMCGFEHNADGNDSTIREIYLDGLKKAAAVNGKPTEVELVFLVAGEEHLCKWCCDNFRSHIVEDCANSTIECGTEHSLTVKKGSHVKMYDYSKRIMLMEKTLFPVSFFSVDRLSRSCSHWSYPPPFFPIPHHTTEELMHVDSGLNFVTGEYVAPKKSVELSEMKETSSMIFVNW